MFYGDIMKMSVSTTLFYGDVTELGVILLGGSHGLA